MQSPFWSARRRLARANKHLDDLEAAIAAHIDSESLEPVTEINASGTHEFHKIRLDARLPDIVTDCTFDAVANFRASLDHAAYAVALAHAPAFADKVHFPISDAVVHFEAILAGKKPPYRQAFPPEILSLFRRLQPYKGGDGGMIWALNRIRRQAEHRLLVRCDLQFNFKLVDVELGRCPEIQFFEYVEGDGDEYVFAVTPAGFQPNYEISIAPRITFGDGVDIVSGLSVHALLEGIGKKVASVIDAIEAEAHKIGVF